MSGTGVLIYKLSHLCYVSRISLRIGKLDSTVLKVLKMPQQWVNELSSFHVPLAICQLTDFRHQFVPGLSLVGFSAQYLLVRG